LRLAREVLPMVEVDGATPLIGERGAVTLLDAFEGRRMLLAYYFMWHTGRPAPEQCEGCHLGYIAGLRAVLHSFPRRHRIRRVLPRPVTKRAPGTATSWGWEMPWYSAQDSLDTLLVGRRAGMMHIVCYLRQGSTVFETYWTTIRGVEAMDNTIGCSI